jgi:hypothetical protein
MRAPFGWNTIMLMRTPESPGVGAPAKASRTGTDR